MSHRDRVLGMLRDHTADRVPMWYGAAPETTAQVAAFLRIPALEESVLSALDVDFRTVRPAYRGPHLATYPDGSRDTIWGVRRGGAHWGQALNHPLAQVETVAEIEAYPWPRVEDWDIAQAAEMARAQRGEYAIIGGDWSPFFHDVAELFGMERMFVLAYDSPQLIEAATEKVMEFYLKSSRRMFEQMGDLLDVFFFGNDFGAQTGLLCSPQLWRRFFGPWVKRMIDLGHEFGLVTALHACGSVREIIPDLIEMGLDMLNPVQVGARGMEPEGLARDFGRDIVFFGGVDVQDLLPRGTPEQVREETRRLISIFTARGGYVLAPAHDYLLPETPPENIVAMYEAGREPISAGR